MNRNEARIDRNESRTSRAAFRFLAPNHRARTALAFGASFFGSDETASTQKPEKRGVRIDAIKRKRHLVDHDLHIAMLAQVDRLLKTKFADKALWSKR